MWGKRLQCRLEGIAFADRLWNLISVIYKHSNNSIIE